MKVVYKMRFEKKKGKNEQEREREKKDKATREQDYCVNCERRKITQYHQKRKVRRISRN